ncbi:hypothetical protein [Kosakonia sacchari]|uniref:hypothetical protein n=1 Tax=Kosakonia sacchari TaxID=1158459 RepID=UPI0015855894|nr:hypothetical protein [Kosakonia sacchari]NUL35086.1 hypothetical protein [Kosakonia sacchari]
MENAMKEQNKKERDENGQFPCPTCGGKCNMQGIISPNGIAFPQCKCCGAWSESAAIWNAGHVKKYHYKNTPQQIKDVSESILPPAPETYWYLVSWCAPANKYGSAEVVFDSPWRVGDMQLISGKIANINGIEANTLVILSVFPISAAPEEKAEVTP